MIELNIDNFQQEVLNSDMYVLVKFGAPWCGACRAMAPKFKAFAEKCKDIKVGDVNTDNNNALTNKYGIKALPTLIVFKYGEETQRFIGMPSESDLRKALEY